MSENAITIYDPGAPLNHPANLKTLLFQDEPTAKGVLAEISRAWPWPDLDVQQRHHRTLQLIENAINMMNSLDEKPFAALVRCCQASIVDSLKLCANLDLSIQKATGEFFLVPFGGICTPMIGYRGFIRLICNTGYIANIESRLLYESELKDFKYWIDDAGPHIQHTPDLQAQGDYSKIVGAYAIAHPREPGLPNIGEFMNRKQLEQVKAVSKSVSSGFSPYKNWPDEMARKAPIRRMGKYIPKGPNDLASELLLRAVESDNKDYDFAAYAQAQEGFQQRRQDGKRSRWVQATQTPAVPPKQTASPAQAPVEPANAEPAAPPPFDRAESYKALRKAYYAIYKADGLPVAEFNKAFQSYASAALGATFVEAAFTQEQATTILSLIGKDNNPAPLDERGNAPEEQPQADTEE